jgi:hypothetical protein
MNTFAAMLNTNTIEGYFSILKFGIYGVYQHVGQAHLKQYLAEFDFRHNERIKRTKPAKLFGVVLRKFVRKKQN